MNVFITVDTEFWPSGKSVDPAKYMEDFQRDIYGVTPTGAYGISYQLGVLNDYGLRATFFVEPLCAYAVGVGPLAEIVGVVQEGGQDVQLHIHTEWLDWMPDPIVAGQSGNHMRHFDEDQQTLLIEGALEKLRECGASNVCAFRAGNFGANFDTLRALARNGILLDSSHNAAYLDTACGLRTPYALMQPRTIDSVIEFPITVFHDFRGRQRHAQLCACSCEELEYALLNAWESGWSSFVILSHSFELIKRRSRVAADGVVIRRYEGICRFLDRHRDKFQTVTFSDPAIVNGVGDGSADPLCVPMRATLKRWSEQLLRRLR